MAQVKYTTKQLMNLVDNGVAVNASGAFNPEDRKEVLGEDKNWKAIGYSENKYGCCGVLYMSLPSKKLFVVTGQALYNW